MFNKTCSLLLLLVVLFFLVNVCMAAGPPGPPMGPPCWPPPCTIPLDGGISLLIAAGVALGGKKFYNSRKKSS
jgi:hypothetical protein